MVRPRAPREFEPDLLHDSDLCHKLLDLVGARSQAIVICRLLFGMTHREIKEVLGTSRQTNITHVEQFKARATEYLQQTEAGAA